MYKPYNQHTDVDKKIRDFMDRSLARTLSRSISEWLAPSVRLETRTREDIKYEPLRWTTARPHRG